MNARSVCLAARKYGVASADPDGDVLLLNRIRRLAVVEFLVELVVKLDAA